MPPRPLRLCFSSLSSCTLSPTPSHIRQAHARARTRLHLHVHTISGPAFISLYLKKTHAKGAASAYGAHFCTSGLMLLSSFFVQSIIVLKEKTKRGSVSMLLLHN